tara:strand:+ start:330 stop:998 length:669 start_codon:yes stop_codon:yes gene_type:complete
MSEIRVTSVVGENGGDRVGLTTGLTVGPLTGTTGIGATITHQGHAQFAGVCTATSSTVSSGNVVIGTAGKGIDYSAQSGTAAGMASELLDHYEEGTFSPTFGASNGTSTAAYSTQSGKYTRIGNIVHVQIRITLSSLSTNSHSHAWISGLPIASAERTATSSIICGGMQNSGYNSFPIAGRTEAGATRIELFQATNGGVTDFSTSSVSGTAYFIVQCTYRAA